MSSIDPARDLYVDSTEREDFLRRIEIMGVVADEIRLKKKDGTVMYCQRSAVARRDATGRIVSVQSIVRDMSVRRRIEEEVRRSEGQYRTLFEQSPNAIYLVEADGALLNVNEAAVTLLGYRRDRLLSMNIANLCADSVSCFRMLARAHADGGLQDHPLQLRRIDGAVLDSEVTATAIHGHEGHVTAYQMLVRDVTARKTLEDAIRASEEKFRLLFEKSIDAIFVLAVDGTHVEANQAWLDMFGYTGDELPSIDSARDIYVNPRDREEFLRRIRETGFVADEVRFRRKDGTVMHCQRTVVARRDASGAVVGFQGIIRDITQRERDAEALRRSEEQYRSLFEQSRDAILLTTPDGAVLDANPAFLQLFGYTKDELGGLRMPDLVAEGVSRDKFIARLERDGRIVDDECRFRRKNGTVFDCLRTVVAWHNEKGEVVAHQGLIRDITERKRAEEEITRNEARLRSLVNILEHEAATVQSLLDHAVSEALKLTGSSLGYIYAYNEDRQVFNGAGAAKVAGGSTLGKEQLMRHLEGTGIWAEAVRNRTPVVVNDFQSARIPPGGLPEGHAHLTRYAGIPVFSDGRIVAVVGVANKETDYSDMDVLQLTLLMESVWKVVERRAAEERSSQFAQRLEAAMAAGNLAWWQMSLPSGKVVFDERKVTMLGYSPADFSHYTDFTDLLHPDDCETAMQAMRNHLERKADKYEVEYRIRMSSGGYRWFRDVGGITAWDSDGKPSVVTGIVVDISGIKGAEERLAESNRELRELAARVDTAREEERAAVAWELHDEVAQALSAIKMDITGCAARLPADAQSRIRWSMDEIVALLDSTIARLRRMYTDLVPVMLEDLGLAAAMDWHAEQFKVQNGIEVRLGRVDDLSLRDDRTTLGFFRVFQEAVEHLASHPGASHVAVDLQREDGHARLCMSDDGRGFSESESEASCAVALAGIRERANSWGGSVTVTTSPSQGTVICVIAPLRRE